MSFSNPSQLLQKNFALLEADHPLFVNCPDPQLLNEWLAENSDKELVSLHYNYADYLSVEELKNPAIQAVFNANYKSDKLHDLVVIYFPKSKAELTFTLASIKQSLNDDALILFVGDNNGGVKTVAKLVKEHTAWCRKEDAAKHCSLFVALNNGEAPAFELADWFSHNQIEVNGICITLSSLPGVFSHEKLDKGTRVLLEHMPTTLKGSMLDFGCGAGIISVFAKKVNPDLTLDLIDVNVLALLSSEETLKQNDMAGNIFPSDSLHQVTAKYDVVLSNPPFHQGIQTNYQATEFFLTHVCKRLNKGGELFVIANSFLKYQPIIESYLSNYRQLVAANGFSLHYAKLK